MYSRYLLASSFVLALAAMGAGCSSDKPPEEPASKADANPPQVSASTEQVDATAAGAPGNDSQPDSNLSLPGLPGRT